MISITITKDKEGGESGKEEKEKYCAMINAVSIVTPAMIGGIERQLEKGVKKIVVILDEKDGMSEEAIKEKFVNTEKKRFTFDAEYSFFQSITNNC